MRVFFDKSFQRALPSAVRGPVETPPWKRQRTFAGLDANCAWAAIASQADLRPHDAHARVPLSSRLARAQAPDIGSSNLKLGSAPFSTLLRFVDCLQEAGAKNVTIRQLKN
jgi:hypothetical protein